MSEKDGIIVFIVILLVLIGLPAIAFWTITSQSNEEIGGLQYLNVEEWVEKEPRLTAVVNDAFKDNIISCKEYERILDTYRDINRIDIKDGLKLKVKEGILND